MLRLDLGPLLVLLVLLCAPVLADPYVTGVYWPSSGGYSVELTLHNTLTTYRMSNLKLSTGDALNPWGPLGWTIYQDYRTLEWSPITVDDGVQPGESKGGFGFVLPYVPGSLGWWALANKGYSGSVTPLLIPEPASLLTLAAGLLGLGVWRRRRA